MTIRSSLLVVTLSAVVVTTAAEDAVAQINQEYKLKAHWLYHFGASLVQWEQNGEPPETFVIGVLGDYPGDFERRLDEVKRAAGDNGIRGREIEITRFDTMDHYVRCDILFISSKAARNRVGETANDRLRAALASDETRQDVLIVSEMNGGLAGGNGRPRINFEVDRRNNRLKVQINDPPQGSNLNFTGTLREYSTNRE